MIKRHNPAAIHKPAGNYSHGAEVPAGARMLYIAGQVGARPDGSVPADPAAQAEQVWENVKAILADAGMGPGDLVSLNTYVTSTATIPHYRAARDKVLAGVAPPASALLVVAALANPAWLIEIQGVAAKI